MLGGLFGNRRTTEAAQCNGIIISGDNNQNIAIHYGPTEGHLTIPFKPNSLTDSIDSLLIWQSQLTPLIGRDKTLAELEQWAKTGPRISLKLIHGEGGVGKTRLAFELATLLKKQDWEAGQLATLSGGSGFRLGQLGTLLVIDYPEQQPKRVQQLLQGIKEAEEPAAPLRILLLSRRPELLEQLGESLRFLTAPALSLRPLDEESAAWQLFETTWPRLCQQRRQADRPLPIDQTAFSRWLAQHGSHCQPLFILAYLINLFETPQATTLGAAQIIERLVAREVDRLAREGEAAGLQPVVLPLLKGLAAITGGITTRQLKALAGHGSLVALLPDYEALRHSTIWRVGDGGEGSVVELQPDLLAAALLSRLLKRDDDSPGAWLYAALDVSGDMKKATSRLGRLMHDAIQILDLPWPQQVLNEAVANDLSRCRRLEEGLSRSHLERPLLPLALHVTQRVAEATEEPLEQARLLSNLSVHLAESGDRAGGLKAIQRAAEIYEKLAAENFAAYAPVLASSLNNLSIDLAAIGDRVGGLKVIQRAVEIYEKLAVENFAAYAPVLASSLNNLSNRLAESGDRAEGLKAIQRAVKIHEKLAAENFAAYKPDLASSLNNLSMRLEEHGEMSEAITTVERAIVLITPFAIDGTAYADWLAMMKNNLARYQTALE